MKPLPLARVLGTAAGLLVLCACVTSRPELPPEVTFNPDAARGNELLVKVRLDSGQELPFVVDTGSPITLFDKSLVPKLGKRLAKGVILSNFGSNAESSFYAMPKLYLGTTRLRTGRYAAEVDLAPEYSRLGIPHPMGILGMDCLRHYCLQLDFEAGKLRFLNPNLRNVTELGKRFPLLFSNQNQGWKWAVCPVIQSPSLIGDENTLVLIDTGYRVDGALEPTAFARERLRQAAVASDDKGRVWFARCAWNQGVYTNLLIGKGGNLIGLGFLARHLVTLNFPKQQLYLKQLSVGPLMDERMRAAQAFLIDLKAKGHLPGWSKQESGTMYLEPFPNHGQFDGGKNGEPSVYHYKVAWESREGPWKLQKAWRTDERNQALEEYPVP